MPITLKIYLPDKILPEEKADKVVLPAAIGKLTVINDRAPTIQLLTIGLMELLDSENKTFKRWFIDGGMADIANDVCTLTTERIVDLEGLQAQDVLPQAENDLFYQKMAEYLKAFG